jgi:hypothetical protein
MKINKKELLNILTAIKPGLAATNFVDYSNNFIFTGKEIMTYNNTIAISYPYKSNFKCSVLADKFYNLILNIDEQEFVMIQKENELKIRSKGIKASIQINNINIENIVEEIKPSNINIKWETLPDDFKKGVEFCLFSLSNSNSMQPALTSMRPALTSMLIDHTRIISCDNYRITQFLLKNKIEYKFLLPGRAAHELVKFNIVKYYLTGTWIYFSTDIGVVFCSRRDLSIYPEIDNLLKVEGKKIILSKKIKDNVNIAAIMAEEDFNHKKGVTIDINKNKIICKGESNVGCIESFEIIDNEEDITFKIDPLFFSQILDRSTTLIYDERTLRLLFESDNFKHVLMCRGKK